MEEILNNFKLLGYNYQLPKGRDKTLYLVKQEKETTKQIFVEYTKKKAKVYCKQLNKLNVSRGILTPYEIELIMNYLLDLGITEYSIVNNEVE